MDKNAIQKRIADLEEARLQRLREADHFNGAIQDCEYWLSQLAEVSPAVQPNVSEQKGDS